MVTAGAGLFGSALGGDSYGRQKRMLRKQYKYAARYQPWVNSALMDGRMADAERHSIHPLVAMGINPGAQGFEAPNSVSGREPLGAAVAEAGRAIGQGMTAAQLNKKSDLEVERMRAEIQLLNAQATALGQKPPSVPDMGGTQGVPANVAPPFDPKTQELEKGKVMPHKRAAREQNTSEISPFTKFRMGAQDIWLMAEDAEQLTEDPVTVLATAYLYHGNKHVDWPWLIKDYYYGPGLPSDKVTRGTQKMFERIKARARRMKIRHPGSRRSAKHAGPQPYRTNALRY